MIYDTCLYNEFIFIIYIDVSDENFVYQCGTGNGCDYLIERSYDTGDGCYGNISKAVSWNDTIHLIGGCDGWIGFELASFLPCDDDPNNVNHDTWYGNDVSNCDGTTDSSSSYGYGSCIGDYPRYPVCGTAQVSVCTEKNIIIKALVVIDHHYLYRIGHVLWMILFIAMVISLGILEIHVIKMKILILVQ